jgi:hypothetical protein
VSTPDPLDELASDDELHAQVAAGISADHRALFDRFHDALKPYQDPDTLKFPADEASIQRILAEDPEVRAIAAEFTAFDNALGGG